MFLIDQPYVSDFLIDTIKKYNFQVIATKVAKELITDDGINWIAEKAAATALKNNPQLRLYTNSENALAWVEQHLGSSKLANKIKILKDKVAFRTLIQELFPAFYFQKLTLEEVHQLTAEELPFPFVIKPAVGFFSIGVHIVKHEQDWENARNELQPEKLKSIFPTSVLNTSTFIIEAFIEGEEYAIDYYHDHEGKVVILNVLHHLFSSGTDTSDRVYSTSKAIIEQHRSELELLLNKIGQQLNLKNFPAHAEVRINQQGQIVPIEINPLRFGGWCTTGDLLGVALGFNAYQCFFDNQQPDWATIFKGKTDKKYSIIILNNSSGIEPSKISTFNYVALAEDFEHTVITRQLDIRQFPVFGFLFTETSPENEQELVEILTSDLKKYIA